MAKGKANNQYRRSKRKYYGNQYGTATQSKDMAASESLLPDSIDRPPIDSNVKSRIDLDEEEKVTCSSAKKLKLDDVLEHFEPQDFNLIIHFGILHYIIELVGSCPECRSTLSLKDELKARSGFVHKLILQCCKCSWMKQIFTSHHAQRINGESSGGRKRFDLNVRSVLAFREIGRGHEGMKTVASYMNLFPPVSKCNYNSINKQIYNALTEKAIESCQGAATETKKSLDCSADDDIQNCQVSVDGSWQKRGHISLNGVVTLISKENGKCLDFVVMSKKCKSCQFWERKTNEPGYAAWFANHECESNHDRSSGAMESAGAVMLFKRSVERHQLRYTSYIGDGDSSSYSDVVNSHPYGEGVKIDKLECLGHVQKRMGSRCRSLRQSLKGIVLSDGKKVSGKGRLTDKAINSLQNHYGMAIRQNIGNLYEMKKSIIAILHHSSASEDNDEQHKYCPRTNTTWCKWWLDKLNSTSTYKKNLNLPLAIKDKLKPIFLDLSSDDLLKKCLHGQTQNVNECLNSLIWKKCPKDVFIGRKVLELGVCSAVIQFNEGSCGLFDVYKKLGLVVGKQTADGCRRKDKDRLAQSIVQSSEKAQKRRKKLRSLRKGYIDNEEEREGCNAYCSGSH